MILILKFIYLLKRIYMYIQIDKEVNAQFFLLTFLTFKELSMQIKA